MTSPLDPHGPIYLDYNATTPVDPRVADVAERHLRATFGNPSSTHRYGVAAHAAIVEARTAVADLLGASPDEIVFTGGGSESDNLAIKGIALAGFRPGSTPGHIVTSAVEHPAVLTTCRWLVDRFGFRLTVLPVDGHGAVDPDDLRRAISSGTSLVTLMQANNEVGTLNPIAALAEVCRDRGVPMHTDAAQAVGKVPTRVGDMGVALLTVAGHKLYAPKGVGALYIRRGQTIESLVHGAGHESGRRAGTENVPWMAALGRAAALCAESLSDEVVRLTRLRDLLHERLADAVPGLTLNGHPHDRLPNTLNVSFPRADGQALLAATPTIAASTGSACHEGHTEPSAVLLAMGLALDRALGAIRLSLGRWTTEDEVARAASQLGEAWRRTT